MPFLPPSLATAKDRAREREKGVREREKERRRNQRDKRERQVRCEDNRVERRESEELLFQIYGAGCRMLLSEWDGGRRRERKRAGEREQQQLQQQPEA